MTWILRGPLIRFDGSPFSGGALLHESDGAVAIADGLIADVGPADPVITAHPGAQVRPAGGLISPGFIDAHVHYPQIGVIASWGSDLIDWLNRFTFPEEARFGDPAHAEAAARAYFNEQLRNGTTCAASFCTVHPESVDAYFAVARRRGLRAVGGKVMMSRNAPATVLVDPQRSADQSRALIARWQGVDRLTYAITPRFAPTSTEEELDLAGAMAADHPDCLIQTHLSEQGREVAWVRELYPEARDYLEVYERAGLVRPGAVFGHAIHLTDRERSALAERGASVAHCPTSNQFLGSGECNVCGLIRRGVRVGLSTDTGGGTSFSMLDTMKSAYEVAARCGDILRPEELWWLVTAGAAAALRLEDRIGNIAPGLEADLVVLDAQATPVLAQRANRAESIADQLFALIVLGDDRAVRSTWSAGRLVGGTETPGDVRN